MGYRPRTKFVVKVSGQPRLLLSLRQQNGDVRIIRAHAANFEDGDKLLPIKQQYWSLHRGTTSDVSTLKHTLELKNGTVFDSVNHTFAVKNGLLCFIFAARPALLTGPRYNADPSPRDSIIGLGSMDVSTNSLVYAVVVSGTGVPLDVGNGRLSNILFADFETFRVSLVWAFVHVASPVEGDLVHSMTGLMRVDRQPVPKMNVVSIEGDDSAETMKMVGYTMEVLRGRLLERVAAQTDPKNVPLVRSMGALLQARPVAP
jgi:hypothetical protein